MKSTKKESTEKPKASSTEKPVKFADINIQWWWAAGAFAVFTIIFFWQHLTGSAFFWEDFAEYVYPVQNFAAKEFASGVIPFWNPYTFVGMPFFADLQVGFFYPLNRVLSLFVSSDGTLSVAALQFTTILHFLIAQLSMFFMARHFKVSSIGSMISAVSYAFSFLLVCHVIHPMIVIHLAWLPLILMFLHRGFSTPCLKSGIYAGLLLGMVMLAGHPQMTLYISLFLGLFFIWFLASDIIKGTLRNSSPIKYAIIGIIPFIIALGIFQVQFMPSKELADLSQRNEMTYENSAECSLEFNQIFTSTVPKIFGYANGESKPTVPFNLQVNSLENSEGEAPYYFYWETSYYFGLAALILGLFACMTLFKQRLVAFMIAISLFAFLYALGSNGFLHQLFYNLPFFGQFRNPARMMFAISLAMSLLAGFGFDRLSQSTDKSDFLKLLLAAGFPIIFALLTAIGILPSMLGADERFLSSIQSFGVSALVISIFILLFSFAAFKKYISPIIAGAAILIIAFIDLYIAGNDFNISKTSIAKQYELSGEAKQAFRPSYPDDIFRVNMRMYNPSYMAMKRNQGMVSGIQLVEGYNPLLLQKVVPPLNTKEEIHSLYNVKYEIEIDQTQGRPFFRENQDRLPRAYLVSNAIIKSEAEIEDFMRNNEIDYSQTVVLEENPAISLSNSIGNNIGSAKIIEYRSNKIIIEVDAAENAILCLSEIYYPAWRATISGKETKILRSNYCFRAVPVEKGKHKIEFAYKSSSFATGAWISLLTLLFCVVTIIISNTDRCRKEFEKK